MSEGPCKDRNIYAKRTFKFESDYYLITNGAQADFKKIEKTNLAQYAH